MRQIRNLFVILVACWSVLFASTSARARDVKATFVVFSDLYEMQEKDGRGGFARIAGAIRAERARNQHVFVVHAGDALSPSLLSSVDRGAHIIDLLNETGIDIFTPGNHEFDFGEATFLARMQDAKFSRLAANIRSADGKRLDGFADEKIYDVEGVRLGVFGLTTPESVTRSNTGALRFAPLIETARDAARKLRSMGADLVIAVTHSEWQDDLRLAKSGAIDLILSGHDHNLLVAYDGRAALAETQDDGANIVAVDLTITLDAAGERRVAWTPRFRIIDTADVAPDPAIAARVAAYAARLDAAMRLPIGKTRTALDTRKASVRGRETAFGDFIADAMRTATGADLAIINGGAIRGDRLYPAGATLTRGDILAELPFDDRLVVIELSGADVMAILENAVSRIGRDDGRFGQISGARIVVRADKAPGARIETITIGGAPLALDRTYRVATIDFLGRGKDGYSAFSRGGTVIGEVDGPALVATVIEAIQRQREIAPVEDARVSVR